jgi:hypothetical protein
MKEALKNWFKTLVVDSQTETNNKIDSLEKTVNHLNNKLVEMKNEQKNSQDLINLLTMSIEELLCSLDPNSLMTPSSEYINQQSEKDLDSEQDSFVDHSKRYLN